MPWNNLVLAQNHAEDMVAPLTSNVCKMHPAALNAIACTCQTICDVISSIQTTPSMYIPFCFGHTVLEAIDAMNKRVHDLRMNLLLA